MTDDASSPQPKEPLPIPDPGYVVDALEQGYPMAFNREQPDWSRFHSPMPGEPTIEQWKEQQREQLRQDEEGRV